jgi:hypothetical protein
VAERAERSAWLTAKLEPTGPAGIFALAPVLAPGVTVTREPVLGEGEFVWGEVVRVPGRWEAVPVSAAVASVLRALDGGATLEKVVTALANGMSQEAAGALARFAAEAVRILFVDGTISELRDG